MSLGPRPLRIVVALAAVLSALPPHAGAQISPSRARFT